MRRALHWTTLLALAVSAGTAAAAATATSGNQTLVEPGSYRRAHKKHRSTSSSSGEKDTGNKNSDENDKDSLDVAESLLESESDEKKRKKYIPVSSADRTGWRKWHRKCTQCPEDMEMKYKSHSIQWVCGGYQRARRSFKSMCMMRLRNCQDGTMFVKIHNHRCSDDVGNHFFYDYAVKVTDESSKSSDTDDTGSDSDSNSNTVGSDFSIDFNDLGHGIFTKRLPLRS